jgi:uncharacterized protein (TIGR02186 family)
MTVRPNPILVDATFHGSTVHVSGATEAENQVFVIISGARTREKFNRKGRVGPLWANVSTVRVSGVPSLCLIASSAPISSGLDRRAIDQHFLDLESVARRAVVEPSGSDTALLRGEYLRLKQSQGVFASLPAGVQVNLPGAQGTFAAAIPWPDAARAGEYTVSVVHVKGGTVLRTETAALQVELVGLPRLISYLAFQRSKLYGVLSVAIALCVGLLTGLVFKKGGGH